MLPEATHLSCDKDLLRLNETKRLQRRLKKLNAPGSEKTPAADPLQLPQTKKRPAPHSLTLDLSTDKNVWLMYAAARHGNIDLHATLAYFCPYYDDFNNMVVMDEALDTTLNIYCSQILKTSPETRMVKLGI
jgi:hypothetical protein